MMRDHVGRSKQSQGSPKGQAVRRVRARESAGSEGGRGCHESQSPGASRAGEVRNRFFPTPSRGMEPCTHVNFNPAGHTVDF